MATQRKRTGQNDKTWKPDGGRGGRAGAATNRTGRSKKKKDPEYMGPGGKPDGSGKGQARQRKPVADYSDAQGNTYDGNSGRLKKAASKPSGSSSKPPAPKPKPTATRPADKVPSSASKTSSRNVGPVASGDDYARNKDPKKYNPLMQKTFGYQKGDAPDQRAKNSQIEEAKSQANKARVKQGPAAPAKPASPNDPKKSAVQKSKNLMEEIRKRRTNR